jgi:hypothetical protein
VSVISTIIVDAFYLCEKRVIRYGFRYTWNLERWGSHSNIDIIQVFWDVTRFVLIVIDVSKESSVFLFRVFQSLDWLVVKVNCRWLEECTTGSLPSLLKPRPLLMLFILNVYGRRSSVGIVPRLRAFQWRNRVSINGRGKKFIIFSSKYSDGLWGPPSLISNWPWGHFHWGEGGRIVKLPTHTYLIL